jgi:putative DNA primase/helicase
MFAIAQIAGGDWPRRALEAYTHLTNQRAPENSRLKTLNPELLLDDIRQIFAQAGTTRLSCKQILNCLRALDRPWSPASAFNAPLTSRWLGHYLHRLGIRSHSLRIGHQSVKGYEVADFSDAFARFLKA